MMANMKRADRIKALLPASQITADAIFIALQALPPIPIQRLFRKSTVDGVSRCSGDPVGFRVAAFSPKRGMQSQSRHIH